MENEQKFIKDKCPSCTGDELIFNQLDHTWKCTFCGSVFKKEEDQFLGGRIDEASELRNHLDFDEALELLDELIEKYPTNAELYFQRILSRYGVTYVDEDENRSSKPTLCRASETKISELADYTKLKQNAPKELKEFYFSKIEELEALRSDIIKRASKQQPFDVFICYKKSVPGMNAFTYDSGKAREIYEKLTKSGYNVFFAEETLADFTGQEYEPVIYNALYSAKVMLVIAASDPAYVAAPWVKNEWSRFIALIESEKTNPRAIVPVLCNGFRVEDLPAKLSKRQILEYDGSFTDKINKVLKTFVKRGVSTNITRNSVETKVEVKPIEVKEVVVEKRGFGGKTTDIAITTRETTALESCRSWLEHKKFKNVINKTEEVLKNNPESQEAAWLYIMASIACTDLDSANDYVFTRFSESKINSLLQKLEVALSYCNEREYRTRTDIIRSIVVNTFRHGDYLAASHIYKFFITLVDDKFENSLAMAIVDQYCQKIEQNGTQVKEKEIDYVKETIYSSLTKLGAKGIISVYNTLANELLRVGNYSTAIKYFDFSLELFKADPDALWGKMLAENKASNDEDFAKKTSNPERAIENVILMQKGGYKLSTARRNYLMRVKEVGIQLLNTSKAKKGYQFFKDVYSLIPASTHFTDVAYELAVTFSELLLLKGYYQDAEEFFKLIIAEHDQLDFTAHLGILKCRAKVKSNFELLAIKKSYYEYYSTYFDNVREAEEESYKAGKLEKRIFTEIDSLHEEILDSERGKSNIIKALLQAATVCEKNLIIVNAYDAAYYTKTGKDDAIRGNKFAISDLVYKEQEKNVNKIVKKSSYDSTYETSKAKSNVKLFNKTQAINLKKEIIFILAAALAGLAIGGMLFTDYMSYGFPLAFAIIFGVVAIFAIIILISQMKEKCCNDFDTENICGSCLGWYFGGGMAVGLGVAIVGGIFMAIGAGGAYLLQELGLNIPLRIVMLIPYIVYKVIDIIKKKKFINAKYIIFSIVMLVAAYILYGYVLRFASITFD